MDCLVTGRSPLVTHTSELFFLGVGTLSFTDLIHYNKVRRSKRHTLGGHIPEASAQATPISIPLARFVP